MSFIMANAGAAPILSRMAVHSAGCRMEPKASGRSTFRNQNTLSTLRSFPLQEPS